MDCYNYKHIEVSYVSIHYLALPRRYAKNYNKHAILDLIRFSQAGISRVELARELDLTRAAVTTIINDLQSLGLVSELEDRRGGRRPIVLDIPLSKGYVVGVDMGATHVGIILTDLSAHVIREIEHPFDINRGPKVCLEQVDNYLQELLSLAGVSRKDVFAAGVGAPGPIISEKGMVGTPPIMPGWDGYPIRDTLFKQWNIPISLNNDAELGAIGEWAYGAGRGEANLVYVKVGMGIGAGLLLDGQIYRGTTGSAGEIGHTTIDEKGPVCSCGNRGCLEAMAGGKSIADRARNAIHKGQRTILESIKPASTISVTDVVAAARRGDLVSQQIFTEAGMHLGTAIASLVNLFNPSMVVVGGGVSQIGDLLLEPIRLTVQQRSLPVASRAVRITSALLGRRSSSLGAVVQASSLVLHQMVE